MAKLTKRERARIEREIHTLTEDALELERKAQNLERILNKDALNSQVPHD